MSTIFHTKPSQSPGLKQVKVDNWGSFFLQRLQQLYHEEELLDLTIKFPTSDITVQAHRLVLTTCTDYFMLLERKQKEREDYDGILVMPPDMPYECVKSIISFMYTGQLEYWTSEQNALYKTAQKMNITVLTKLLDAQFNTNNLQATSVTNEKTSVSMQSKITSPVKKISPTSQAMPTTILPGRKLPIWRRRLDSPSMNSDSGSYGHRSNEANSGPSRFDLPEVEDIALGVFSSFDDITYNTKPIVRATSESSGEKNNSTRSNRNDTEDEDDESQEKHWENNSDDDWISTKSNSRSQDGASASKRVRFELEEKENMEKSKNTSQSSPESINNHAKIIREVLKKYPHLVKNNKNIRLKIMQKEPKSSDSSSSKTKVSYVVLKSDHLIPDASENEEKNDGNDSGPWKCHKCDLDEEYHNYYMYRRHMQDVHDEKFDPRVCEHCGYKAAKRNILMYHLYTKHNVPPPKSMSFPKCHACSYVALSETLLVRHQINHKHRPLSLSRSSVTEEIQCVQCGEAFKDVSELANHEINTGHGTTINGKDKGFRCPYCHKVFVRSTNLRVHIDCQHKKRENVPSETESLPAIPLEPSSEAEALSNVASGIAASLGVGDTMTTETITSDHHQEMHTSETSFVVNEMELNSMTHDAAFNGHGQQMIMLIDNESFDQQGELTQDEHHQQPQQLHISSNEQLVMQGTEDGMIVYIHGTDDSSNQAYATYQTVTSNDNEEIVEEVVEEVLEEADGEHGDQNSAEAEDSNQEQVEEVIQYVEEETEIVEYDEEQSQSNDGSHQVQESMMIIEEEHLERVEDVNEEELKSKMSSDLAEEWDEDSMEMAES
ncbi:centrosome-associated zinc finger protein CP190 [Microplitis mediator]|uniref:centrosome-associated zinc finger protein CP190 n=1 Tax=Microplitis mediator TaxID=375433 RepID=UPI0025547CF2|nr:centrosome-associated zinc finger protein CP190 [Microplitis mediator]XP_057326594.1 centrosome-associated zinc finger protein CP190 [Microplitis mediator]XP_057326595.1 centrosome-associated zinc finger protein CP190 [Microplitis mediator]